MAKQRKAKRTDSPGQPSRPQATKSNTDRRAGFPCMNESCGAKRTIVVRTVPKPGPSLQRVRRCEKCGHEFPTNEFRGSRDAYARQCALASFSDLPVPIRDLLTNPQLAKSGNGKIISNPDSRN
jgi:hypothetical protein